jgi:hypothetical protein
MSRRLSLLLLSCCAPALGAQAKHLRAVPDATFDATAVELSSPPGIRVNAQLQVFVTDRDGKRMLRLSPDGQQADVVVREGAGPGEGRGFIGPSWKGDTLYFFDNWQSRFTLLDQGGTFLKTLLMSERCSSIGTALMGDGCLEYVQNPGRSAAGPDLNAPMPVILTSAQKQRTDTLGMMSREHTLMIFRQSNGMMYATQPFSDDATISPALNGTVALELKRAAATSARPDSIQLRLWTRSGGWGRWSVVRYEPRPLEKRVIDSAITAQADGYKKHAPWVTRDSLAAKIYRPRFYPPAPQIMSTSDGTIWIRLVHAKVPAGTTSWAMFDERLTERARVSLPAAFRPLDARADYVWGYVLDEDDVPIVVRYRLIPA